MLVQLDFWEKDEMSVIRARMEKVEDSADRCRKKQFAQIGELRKIVDDLVNRLSVIERGLCK